MTVRRAWIVISDLLERQHVLPKLVRLDARHELARGVVDLGIALSRRDRDRAGRRQDASQQHHCREDDGQSSEHLGYLQSLKAPHQSPRERGSGASVASRLAPWLRAIEPDPVGAPPRLRSIGPVYTRPDGHVNRVRRTNDSPRKEGRSRLLCAVVHRSPTEASTGAAL